MPSPLLETPPFTTDLIGSGRMMHPRWTDWLQLGVIPRLNASPEQTSAPVSLTAQDASIAPTTIYTVIAAGLYRVSWYLRITTAGSVSSSIQVSIGTTDGGVACAQPSATYTGNSTAEPMTGVILVRSDAASPITVSTTYASTPATVMKYRIDLIVEAVG